MLTLPVLLNVNIFSHIGLCQRCHDTVMVSCILADVYLAVSYLYLPRMIDLIQSVFT